VSLQKYSFEQIQREYFRRIVARAPASMLAAALEKCREERDRNAEAAKKAISGPLVTVGGVRGEFLEVASEFLGESLEAILAPTRGHSKTTRARHVAMAAMRAALPVTLAETAEAFRREDHGTICNAVTNVRNCPTLQSAKLDLVARWEAHKANGIKQL